MGREFLEIGEMSTDDYGYSDEGTWFINNFVSMGSGYQTVGESSLEDLSISDSDTTQGTYVWRKGYNTHVMYHATSSDIYEVGVGSRVSTLNVPTYGVHFAAFGPALYATNGVNNIQVTTGGTFADITIPTVTGNTFANPRPKFLITFRNQLVGANITTAASYGPLSAGTYPHLVWWSALGNGEMWGTMKEAPDGLGSNYVPIFDGSYEITGLAAGEDCVFVFKEHSIFRLDGPDFAVSPVTLDVGCIAPRAIQRVGEEIYFISQYGLTSINSRSAEVKYLTRGKVSITLLSANADIYDAQRPPDHADVAASISMGIDAKRVTMAADVENGIVCVCYSEFTGGYQDFTLLFYNTSTGRISFGNLYHTGVAFTSALAFTDPRDADNAFPLGTICFAVKTSATAHKLFRLSQLGHINDHPGYIRWPYKLFDPKKRTSIRSVRPVFKDAFYNEGLGINDYTLTAKVYSETVTGATWPHQKLSTGTAKGNDNNITIENCPMAEMHSIGLLVEADVIPMQIYGFKGIEVEWEDGPPINA